MCRFLFFYVKFPIFVCSPLNYKITHNQFYIWHFHSFLSWDVLWYFFLKKILQYLVIIKNSLDFFTPLRIFCIFRSILYFDNYQNNFKKAILSICSCLEILILYVTLHRQHPCQNTNHLMSNFLSLELKE